MSWNDAASSIVKRRVTDKVLIIGCEYYPITGGIAQVLAIYERYIFEDFHFIANSKWSGIGNILVLLAALFQMVVYLLWQPKTRIVHIHTATGAGFFRSMLFVSVAKLMRRKVVLHFHSGGMECFFDTYAGLKHKCLKIVDALIVLANSWQTLLEKEVPTTPTYVVPNPCVPLERVPRKVEDGLLNLLFLGTLHKQKGVYDLIETIAAHREEWYGKVLLHIGGAGEDDNIISLIKRYHLEELVLFHGWVDSLQRRLLLEESDVLVLPSYLEGQPMVILEAMTYGLAIIATQVGGISQIVSKNNSFLLTPGDKRQLYDSIQKLCTNNNLLRKMQQASVNESDAYTPEKIAQALSKLYSQL